MIYYIISAIFILIASYCILAIAFKVPGFKTSKNINKLTKINEEKTTISDFIGKLSKPFAKYIPISLAKEIKLEKLLRSALSRETPHEFKARLILSFILICLLGLPLALINHWLVIAPIVFAFLFVLAQHGDLEKKSEEQQLLVKKEIPRLIENFTHSIKTNRNIINIFDNYISNYDSYLSKELTKTVADMRTGSQEIALQRFEMRMNNPLVSQLVRGILATLRGEDMTMFFTDLTLKVSAMRKQYLTEQALKVKPKISRISTIRAMMSIGVLLTVIVSTILNIKFR